MKQWKIFVLGCFFYLPRSFAALRMIDKTVAIVNDNVILLSDIDNAIDVIEKDYGLPINSLSKDQTLRYQVLNRLIIDTIILEIARKANFQIKNTQLDQIISNIAAQNGITVNQLRSNLAYKGVSFRTYRESLRKQILLAEVRNNEVRHRITIVPQEINSFVQQIHYGISNKHQEFNLSYLTVPVPEEFSQVQLNEAEEFAFNLAEKSKKGAHLKKILTDYISTFPLLRGGEIGWTNLEKIPLLFAIRLQDAKKGDTVGPIRFESSFYIFKINSIRNISRKSMPIEVHVRHIFLRNISLMSDQQVYEKLNHLADQIRKGYLSFSDVAKKLSEDTNSASRGGDLGWNSIDTFEPVLQNMFMNMKKEEISLPIHLSFGWHLFQLLDSRQEGISYDMQKDRAYQAIFMQKITETMQAWINEKLASSYVRVMYNKKNVE